MGVDDVDARDASCAINRVHEGSDEQLAGDGVIPGQVSQERPENIMILCSHPRAVFVVDVKEL